MKNQDISHWKERRVRASCDKGKTLKSNYTAFQVENKWYGNDKMGVEIDTFQCWKAGNAGNNASHEQLECVPT